MTSWIVIDAGVFLASVLQEQYSDQVAALLEWVKNEGLSLAAPELCRYEMASSLRKIAHRGPISPPDGERLLTYLLSQPVRYFVDRTLILQAYALATQYRLPTAYDAQYLALAERLGCDLWTYDRRLFNTVQQHLTWIRHVADFTPPQG
jgi:predicted nucleic acid-binding protein